MLFMSPIVYRSYPYEKRHVLVLSMTNCHAYRMQLDVESLRTFLAVLDNGGMTAAARELNTSQSAVSWKIKRLEERVGRQLLLRDGRTLRPSFDGRNLIDDARSIVAIHDRAACRLECSDLSGAVRLGADEEVATSHMANLLGQFKRLHPNTAVEFVIDASQRLPDKLATGEIDVAVFQTNADDIQPGDEVLWTEQLHWMTSEFAPFVGSEVPLIIFGDDCFYRDMAETVLDKAGIDHHIVFSGQSSSAVRAAVEAGLGVAVLSTRYLEGDMVTWEPEAELATLPDVFQVARSTPGQREPVVEALFEAIVSVSDEMSISSVA